MGAYDGAGRAHDLWAGKDNAGDSTVNGDEIRLVTTYDRLGRPIQEARTIEVSSSPYTETATFGYDVFSQVTSAGVPLASATRTLTYEYDAAGRRTKMTFPDAEYFTYVWNNGQLTDIRESGSTSVASFAYDVFGRRETLTRGNGATTTYTYDADTGVLDSLALNIGPSTTYDQTWSFDRNQAGQIVERDSTNSAAYDAAAPGGGSVAYAANGRNQYSTINPGSPVTQTYSNLGNLTGDGGYTYAYDIAGRLTGINSGSTTFSYDALGRLQKIDAPSTPDDVLFLYDGVDLVAEYSPGGTILRRYVHGPGADEPLVRYEVSNLATDQYFVADHLGSIVAITNGSGNAVDLGSGDYTLTYGEYGAPDASAASSRFGYTGQVYVSQAGAYNYKARFYDPETGRFISPDPIGMQGGVNLYGYVGNDPLNYIDLTGLYYAYHRSRDTWYWCPGDTADMDDPNYYVGFGECIEVPFFNPMLNNRSGPFDGADYPPMDFSGSEAHSSLNLPSQNAPRKPFGDACLMAELDISYGAQIALNFAVRRVVGVGFKLDGISGHLRLGAGFNGQGQFGTGADILVTQAAQIQGQLGPLNGSYGYEREASLLSPSSGQNVLDRLAKTTGELETSEPFIGLDVGAAIGLGVNLKVGVMLPPEGESCPYGGK